MAATASNLYRTQVYRRAFASQDPALVGVSLC